MKKITEMYKIPELEEVSREIFKRQNEIGSLKIELSKKYLLHVLPELFANKEKSFLYSSEIIEATKNPPLDDGDIRFGLNRLTLDGHLIQLCSEHELEMERGTVRSDPSGNPYAFETRYKLPGEQEK